MSMAADVAAIADVLDRARVARVAIPRITIDHPELGIADGYRVQKELVRRRLAEGHSIIGYKMGLTSPQKMKQMGVESPIYGVLFESTRVEDGGRVAVADHIHPMVEPEVAFVLARALHGPRCSVESVLAATARLAAAIEIIDSRYERYQFDLPSVIADNTSAGRFVVGAGVAPASVELASLGVVLERNGEAATAGTSAAVLGNPALSVAMLADLLAEGGAELPAGSIVMSGGITAAVAVSPGDHVVCRIDRLGTAAVRFD